MHLVYKSMEKEPLPTTLPPQLIPPSKRKGGSLPGAVAVMPGVGSVLPVLTPGGRSTPTLTETVSIDTSMLV